VEEAEQEVRAVAEPREATIGLVTDLLSVSGVHRSAGLDVSMTALFGIPNPGHTSAAIRHRARDAGQELFTTDDRCACKWSR